MSVGGWLPLAGAAHLFVVLWEEPTLAAKFGAPYEQYRATVSR
jgi:protein-S-isoprenylcysteine O-methyltransferase Ste14